MRRYQEVRPQNDPQFFAVKPVDRLADLQSCAYLQEAGGDPGAGLIRPGRNTSVSSVMSSAQNRCRPRPLDLV